LVRATWPFAAQQVSGPLRAILVFVWLMLFSLFPSIEEKAAMDLGLPPHLKTFFLS